MLDNRLDLSLFFFFVPSNLSYISTVAQNRMQHKYKSHFGALTSAEWKADILNIHCPQKVNPSDFSSNV